MPRSWLPRPVRQPAPPRPLAVERLEERTTPVFTGGVSVAAGDLTGDGYTDIVTGAGPGGGPHVKAFSGATGGEVVSFYAYDPAFRGGVSVAVADVTGDGNLDIVTGAGPGGGPHVKAFDGVTLAEVFSVMAFDPAFTGGVSVAAADLDGDGRAEVIGGAGVGGGPHVKAFSVLTGAVVRDFMAFAPTLTGGVSVAAGDVTGDGRVDLVAGGGPGVGGGPVRVFDGTTGLTSLDLLAYEPAWTGGVRVAVGDVDGDGRGEVLTGAMAGGGPRVRVFVSGGEQYDWPMGSFFAYAPDFAGGVFLAAADLDADGRADLITGAGPGGGPHVRAFRSDDVAELASFTAYDPTATGGGFARPQAASGLVAWNTAFLSAVAGSASTPPEATRAMAVLNLAAYDVQNALAGRPGYAVTLRPAAGVDPTAAMAAAAHAALTFALPSAEAVFDLELAKQLGGVPDGAGEDAGVRFGREVAEAVIDLRRADGSDTVSQFAAGSGVGEWRPTPPLYAEEQNPQWATLTPFVLNRPDQFRPDAPPTVGSPAWQSAFDEVKRLGEATSSARTDDQTATTVLWADGAGTFTPPGHWLRIALDALRERRADADTTARLLAALSLTLADTSIASWDAKYTYAAWRPVTAIRDDDQSARTWTPLLVTPNHPEYVSGHSSYSRAAAVVLESFFPGQAFTTTGTALGRTVTRSYPSFAAAADDAGRSRVYGGIHFEFSNQAGQTLGRQVAEAVLGTFADRPDRTGPAITFTTPADRPASANLAIAGRVNDRGSAVATLTVRVDGGAAVPVPFDPATGRFSVATTLPTDGTADGPHTFAVTATDAAGNTATETFTLRLDTRPPALTVSGPTDGQAAPGVLTLAGTIDADAVAITYSLDEAGGPKNVPVAFDPAGGTFTAPIDLRFATPGPRTLTVRATDAAGNVIAVTRAFDLTARPPLTVLRTLPEGGAADVGVTFRPRVFFSRPVSGASGEAIFAVGPDGTVYTPTVALADDKTSAWVFFATPLPGGTALRLVIDGSRIVGAAGGVPLDAAGTGAAGSRREVPFTTVSRAATDGVTVQQVVNGELQPATPGGTFVTGIIADPGPDLKPGTPDDVRAGADGLLMTADDVYRLPLAGVEVYALGREDVRVRTDAAGRFTLTVPAGTVKLAIDGRTATNPSAGVFFPEMVMDLVIEPGLPNTVMGSMGTAEQRAANEEVLGVYLPRVASSVLTAVGAGGAELVADAAAAPTLSPDRRAGLRLSVPANTTVLDDAGGVVAAPQIGVSAVPIELVREMLPPGVPQGAVDFAITIQAPGVAAFGTPLSLTVPNTGGAAPGTKVQFFSFDHTTGRLEIEGTATVSADGRTVTTDPGQGITHPGWHGTLQPGDVVLGLDGEYCIVTGPGGALDDGMGQVDRLLRQTVDTANLINDATRDRQTDFGIFDEPRGPSTRLPFLKTVGQFIGVVDLLNAADTFRDPTKSRTERLFAFLELVVAVSPVGRVKTVASIATNAFSVYQTYDTFIGDDNAFGRLRDLATLPPCTDNNLYPFDDLERLTERAQEAVASATAALNATRDAADYAAGRLERLQAIRDEVDRVLSGADRSAPDFGLSGNDLDQLGSQFDSLERTVTELDARTPFYQELANSIDALTRVQDLFTVPNRTPTTAGSDSTAKVLNWGFTGGGQTTRGNSAPGERIQPFAPPRGVATLAIYDPITDRYGERSAFMNDARGENNFGGVGLRADDGPDVDGDGISDRAEGAVGTSANRADTDGDGVSDRAELLAGTDPLGGRIAATGVVSRLDLGGSAVAVEVVSAAAGALTALVAVNGTAGSRLAVADVSDPVRPVLLSTLDLSVGPATRMAVDPDLGVAAVAGTGGVQLVDVSDPARPLRLAAVGRAASALELADGVAYLAAGSSLVAVDTFSGLELVTIPTGIAAVNGMTRDGNFLYLSGENGGTKVLRTIDLTDPALARGTAVALPAGGGPVFVGGGVAYVGSRRGTAGYTTVNVANPLAPVLIAAPDFPTSVGTGATAVAVAGGGVGLFTAGGGSEQALDLFDVRTASTRGAFRTRFNLTGLPLDVAAANGLAFVATSPAGLTVVNYLSADVGTTPPTVSLALPGVVGGTVQEATDLLADVTATDDVQVRSVELLVNGRVVRTDPSFPFDGTLPLPTLAANGGSTVTVQARATDTGGNVGLSAPITLTLAQDTTPPVLLTDPPVAGVRDQEFGAVRVRFSEPINPSALTAGAFALVGPGGAVTPTAARLTRGGREVILTYGTVPAGDYQFVIRSAQVTDRVGLPLGPADRTFPVKVVRAITSRFETDTEGWTLSNDAATPVQTAGTGNPGGALEVTPITGGQTMYWTSPAKFRGDVSGAFGQTLSFDLWTDQVDGTPGGLAGSDHYVQLHGTAVLSGGPEAVILARRVVLPAVGAWTSYTLPLSPAGWAIIPASRNATDFDRPLPLNPTEPTADQFRAVLATLTGLHLPGEFSSGNDTDRLDNVMLLVDRP